MAHTTTWEANGIYWKYSGATSLNEIAQANTEFYSNHRSDASRYQIFDALEVDEITGSDEELKMLAAIDFGASRSIKSLRVALIVQDSVKHLSQSYIDFLAHLGCTWECRIFPSLAEARKWVDR